MLRYALIYGPIAGLVAIGAIIAGFVMSGGQGAGGSQWLGYLIMILALTLIYFATRKYRDDECGGVLSFRRALGMGVIISVIASLTYVVVWEFYMALSTIDFMAMYSDGILEKMRADGATAQELSDQTAKLEALKAQYENPWFRLPITFSEIFPVGLLVSLVSAWMLRSRPE